MNQNTIEKMINAMKIAADDVVLLNYWSEGDERGFIDGFKKLSVNVPAQWRNSLSKAKEHDDFCTIRRDMVAEGILERKDGEYILTVI